MKYFQLEGIINEGLVTSFMDFCNNNITEECTIVINSAGGKSTLATVILDIINSHSEKITLISAGVYSAAFYIFFYAKCKKKIIYGSLGMHHKCYLKDVFINEKGKPKYQEDICQIENLKSTKSNYLENFMTDEEKVLFDNDDDVYFTFNRMKELFPTVEIIQY